MLFHSCLQTSYDGRGEACTLHLVQSFDGDTLRGSDKVDGGLGVEACLLKQLDGSAQRLQHHLLRVVGLEPQFYASL